MLLAVHIVIALFIAWIWVDYYRQIDIYDRDELKYLVGTFAIGCGSVLVVTGISEWVLWPLSFDLNGELLNDFLYCVIGIGAVEEFSKGLSFLLAWRIFRREFKEPIDYIAYFCTAALGFAAVENVLYFHNFGSHVISGRAILSTVSHMFCSAIVAYGIVLYKYNPKYKSPAVIFVSFGFAALSHGIYDFLLMMNFGSTIFRFALTLLYFLLTLSFFAVILNNAINTSSFFSYQKVVNSSLVNRRLFTYYAVVFGAEVLLNTYQYDIYTAMAQFRFSMFTSGAVVIITVVRLSRFRLIQGEWQRLRFEFPFRMSYQRTSGLFLPQITIKGESYNETMISTFFERHFELHPVSKRRSYMKRARMATIYEKMYPLDHQAIFRIKLYLEGQEGEFKELFIRPRIKGTMLAQGKYVIVGLYKSDITDSFHGKALQKGDLKFLEWAYIKELEKN